MEVTEKGAMEEKLTPNCDGPSMISKVVLPGTIRLITLKEDDVLRT